MDWDIGIERNRAALLRIIAALFAMAGIARGAVAPMLTRRVRSMILLALRPAESACRRLIVVVARTMSDKPDIKRDAPTGPIPKGTGREGRLPSFPLFDTRKRFAARRRRPQHEPRISSIGYIDPVFAPPKPEPTPDDLLDAVRLCQRLETLARALEDLPKQARRLVRAQAQRRLAPPGPRRVPPLRPGWPPGYRQRHRHPVDAVLYHCHVFALRALEPPPRLRRAQPST